jgi:hypothetical protein
MRNWSKTIPIFRRVAPQIINEMSVQNKVQAVQNQSLSFFQNDKD